MSEIYGAEHLLRMFGRLENDSIVQLPTLIAHTNMDADTIANLVDFI